MDPRLALLLGGAALLAAGYLGVFFGKLIKAAISRQREYLADAAAVQFTRNPDSIGGALLKIGGYAYGSELKTPRSEEASHMMFSNAMGSSMMLNALASHPPIEKRIKAVLPHWDGTWPQTTLPEIGAERSRRVPVSAHPEGAMAGFQQAREKVTAAEARTAIDRIGSPTGDEIASAKLMGAAIPPELRGLIRDTAGAQAVVFAMLISENPEAREREKDLLNSAVDSKTAATVQEIADIIETWHSSQIIAMIDLALPSLRRLTTAEYGRFSHIIQQLIAADGEMDLFEFMLQKVVRRHLDFFFRRTAPPQVEIRRFEEAAPEAAAILSAFADLVGEAGTDAHSQALAAAANSLRDNGIVLNLTPQTAALDRIDTALDRFDRAAPFVKKQLLHACAAAALADGQLSSEEAELLRAVADTIGCPVPPFVQQVKTT